MLINKKKVKNGLIEIANQKLNPMRKRCGYEPVTRVSAEALETIERATLAAMNQVVENHRAGSKSITLK